MDSSSFNMIDLILKKREKGALSQQEIEGFISGYTAGTVPDYQASALLMASFLNGMDENEMVHLTRTMLHSGRVLDLHDIPGLKVDKHSTGGVGDKMSIILAPIVASCGVPVPMISGRGLGHTGGTLDKLESIPGFSTHMDIEAYRNQLADIGLVMIGQTEDIAPADKKLYALRDVTATVEFIPFIAASILSKKLAEGIDALVLDVKFGSGSFMSDETKARQLAETLADLAERFGKKTVALLTDMDQPLGRGIGNWPEIQESIACLQGEGPDDVMEVTLALAAEMIVLGGKTPTIQQGMKMAQEAVVSGAAWAKFRALVTAQGGSLDAINNPTHRDSSKQTLPILATQAGRISRVDARIIGKMAVALGAGRMKKEDVVDPIAGIWLHVKVGDQVAIGDPLAVLQATSSEPFESVSKRILSAFEFDEDIKKIPSRIKDRYSNGVWVNP